MGENKVWQCRIGPAPSEVPNGGDLPMRLAVEAAFEEMFGAHPEANFSGWGYAFTESERAVIENRPPRPDHYGEFLEAQRTAIEATIRVCGERLIRIHDLRHSGLGEMALDMARETVDETTVEEVLDAMNAAAAGRK